LYDEWHGTIIDRVLRTGGVIKKGNGVYKKFDSNNSFVSYHKNVSKERISHGKTPSWHSKCQDAVNLKKGFYNIFR